MLPGVGGVHLLVGELFGAACGRIGYESQDDTIGATAGAAPGAGGVSVGAAGLAMIAATGGGPAGSSSRGGVVWCGGSSRARRAAGRPPDRRWTGGANQ